MESRTGIICRAAAASVALAAVAFAPAAPAATTPFKQANVHFETNASACDMGIQISFDTDGITAGDVDNPLGQEVFSLGAVPGEEETHDITEVFQERVEPPIADLEQALGCEPSADAISLAELLSEWPAGLYEFGGESGTQEFASKVRLTHKVPAGPVITAPADGAVVPHDSNLLIRWRKVTSPILPSLGPVEIVGYHVVVVDIKNPTLALGKTKTSFNADLSRSETSMLVPAQYLEPNRIYEFEVLATEKGGNQTITEGGVFCTLPITPANCEEP